MQFTNKVVVVTGSSSGIGLALAWRFAKAGARVVRADIKEGPSCFHVPSRRGSKRTDVGSKAEVKALVDSVLAEEGEIDLFVSNAGIHIEMDALAPESDWQRIFAVNQMSHIWAARHVIPAMLKRGRGHLLITASAVSFLSEIFSAGYATSKYAAYGFAEWLAFSYRARGLRVSVACPGPVWSPMLENLRYTHDTAITAKEAADKILEGLADNRFLITTHAQSLEQFWQKAADADAYVDFLADYREHALSLQATKIA